MKAIARHSEEGLEPEGLEAAADRLDKEVDQSHQGASPLLNAVHEQLETLRRIAGKPEILEPTRPRAPGNEVDEPAEPN